MSYEQYAQRCLYCPYEGISSRSDVTKVEIEIQLLKSVELNGSDESRP